MDKKEDFTLNNIIQIADFSILEKKTKWGSKECKHRTITLNDNGQIVTCCDCGQQVSAYWMLKESSNLWKMLEDQLKRREDKLREDKEANLHRIASRRVDKIWRCKDLVPCCPHCGEGISTSDELGSVAINKRVDEARRRAREAIKK